MATTSFDTRIGKDLETAVNLLKQDLVVAIPTETVYGLAGNALSEEAVNNIFSIKNRPLHNPLIIHIADLNRLPELVEEIPQAALLLLEKFSPGPLTVLLRKNNIVPNITNSGLTHVAIRLPRHPMALELLSLLPFPLAAPSANPFGYISPTSPQHVMSQLQGKIPYILDGGICERGIESTVVGFEGDIPVIYRLGAISIDDIRKVSPKMIIRDKDNVKPQSPGMLAHHYSPATKLILTDQPQILPEGFLPEETGWILFDQALPQYPSNNQIVLSAAGNLEEAAKNLYSALHELDARALRLIIAQRMPDIGLGKAINDRLERAAAK